MTEPDRGNRGVSDAPAQARFLLDRFYLETDFSKGHLSNILRGNGSPTVTTLAKLASALNVEVHEFFVFPERSPRDRAIEILQMAKPEVVRRVLRLLAEDAEKS